jgi:hypothetical protein
MRAHTHLLQLRSSLHHLLRPLMDNGVQQGLNSPFDLAKARQVRFHQALQFTDHQDGMGQMDARSSAHTQNLSIGFLLRSHCSVIDVFWACTRYFNSGSGIKRVPLQR